MPQSTSKGISLTKKADETLIRKSTSGQGLSAKGLSKRILILFIVTTSVLILQGIYNIFNINDVNNSITRVYGSVNQVSMISSQISLPISELRQLSMSLVMAPNQKLREELKQQIFELQKNTEVSIVSDSKIQHSEPKAEQLFSEIIHAWTSYSDTVNTTIEFVESDIRIAEFINVTLYEKRAYDRVTGAIVNYNNYQLDISEEVYQTAQDNSRFAFWAVVATTIIEAVILKIILAYVLNLVRQYIASKKQHEEELMKINRELAVSLHDLKQVQVKLIESEKMALLGQLVAGVSHELNTPVGVGIVAATNMQTCSNSIEESLAKGEVTEEELAGFIELTKESAVIIEKNLRKAGQLIKSFKDVAVEQHSEEFRKFSVNEALEDILLSMKPKLREAGHSIEVRCPNNLVIETNLGAIYHVLTNLIINAITHGFEPGEKGEIKLEVKQVNQDTIQINFSDNGSGMSEEVKQQIFTPFYTTNRSGGGTGLGLSIAYNAIAKIGGHISCESTLGQGTHFFIELKCNVISPNTDS